MSKELVILFSYQERLGRVDQDNKIPVAIRLGETPVPIPNTMVKTQEADGTMLETAWESRWLPDYKKNSGNGSMSSDKTKYTGMYMKYGRLQSIY